MNSLLPFKALITWRIRLFLYISSLSSLVFMQNYCTNVCPFIDGLQPMQITFNLGLVFIFHVVIRELLLSVLMNLLNIFHCQDRGIIFR